MRRMSMAVMGAAMAILSASPYTNGALFRQQSAGSRGPGSRRRKKFKPSVRGEHRRGYWRSRGK